MQYQANPCNIGQSSTYSQFTCAAGVVSMNIYSNSGCTGTALNTVAMPSVCTGSTTNGVTTYSSFACGTGTLPASSSALAATLTGKNLISATFGSASCAGAPVGYAVLPVSAYGQCLTISPTSSINPSCTAAGAASGTMYSTASCTGTAVTIAAGACSSGQGGTTSSYSCTGGSGGGSSGAETYGAAAAALVGAAAAAVQLAF